MKNIFLQLHYNLRCKILQHQQVQCSSSTLHPQNCQQMASHALIALLSQLRPELYSKNLNLSEDVPPAEESVVESLIERSQGTQTRVPLHRSQSQFLFCMHTVIKPPGRQIEKSLQISTNLATPAQLLLKPSSQVTSVQLLLGRPVVAEEGGNQALPCRQPWEPVFALRCEEGYQSWQKNICLTADVLDLESVLLALFAVTAVEQGGLFGCQRLYCHCWKSTRGVSFTNFSYLGNYKINDTIFHSLDFWGIFFRTATWLVAS